MASNCCLSVGMLKSIAANPSAEITAQICTAGPTVERMAVVKGTTVCDVQSEMCHVTSCRDSDVKFIIGIVMQKQI
jgi:hypothetical protein